MKLVVGLGNPGLEYTWSRHNAGWLIIDSYTSMKSLGEPRMKFGGAFWSASQFEGSSAAFLKPYTYMNLSGKSVLEAAKYFDIAPEDVLVVFDDTAIPFGTLRYRASGSAGGHKGMMSIIAALDTLDIPRLRIGVGGPPAEMTMINWVLGKISKDQRDAWHEIESIARDALIKWFAGAPDGFTLKITGA